MSLQALREQRAAKAKALQELVKKGGEWTADNQAAYDAGIAEIEAIDANIERHQRMNQLAAEAALSNGVIDAAERIGRDQDSEASRLFAKWLRGGDNALSAEEWRAHLAAVQNTMSTTTGSEGGYTVQTDVAKSVLDALKAYGGMRAPGMATVIQTAGGNPMSFPTSDGTAEEGEIVDQNASASDADVTFGTKDLPVYKYSSKVVTVPIELLQDSSVDVEAFVRGRLVTRLGRITNKHSTVGTGTNQPNGVMVAAGTGKTGATGQTAAVVYDDLVDLEHSVDPAYREGGECRFMMHDDSVKVVKKLKDTQNRPIFLPGYDPANNGKLDTLLGYPIQINQQVATMAANAYSIGFGDFSKYVIRDVMDIVMQRFTDSAYAKKGQVGFLAWLRSGGNFMDVGGAVKRYRNSAT
ncbi:phage major capsid protein [Sphingobium yanoikuyae]|uniref:Phage major capsid protein n=1 Tax=Sphingobium yanoikuyae TaxID=13690 RepID=A0A3G2UTI6_SPHYA|nr:phage major capsid protein [Sphingobium yanoikuyae]AYO78323.1 phage major capsid protein [Sphingobium yanoikuyae]